MTLNQLRAFIAVVASGSFSAAATEMRMTQPSISELIKRMEESYGVRLFTRGPRRLVLTSAGEELLPFARKAVEAAASADHALRSFTALEGGVATFGLLRNANYYFLSKLVQTFHERHPKVRLRIVGLNSVEVAESVTSGELEAGELAELEGLIGRIQSPWRTSPSRGSSSTTPITDGAIRPDGRSSSEPSSRASLSPQ